MEKNNRDHIDTLLRRLEALVLRQEIFDREVQALRSEIQALGTAAAPEEKAAATPPVPETKMESGAPGQDAERPATVPAAAPEQKAAARPPAAVPAKTTLPYRHELEAFIGENLINKIGIAILVIGVAIGAKYSIDNNLISPLTRIVLGYLAGIGLLGSGIKLKAKYHNYSAVLVSGAMAIFYFITFAAYSFYGLIPQALTFVLMVLFTAFTVLAALSYDLQSIAHIGLVGAYAVPFLLSSGSGRVGVLFSYMAIINTGILVTAFRKYWKSLYYVSFLLTWLIYLSWYASGYTMEAHFGLALTFLFIFFSIFYLTFLSYKLLRKEVFAANDVQLLLANSFTFYGTGYSILSSHETGAQLLGLFTLFNALVHFVVSVVFYRQKLADRNLFYLVSGLVLVFITISVPVQLDGHWVTLLWIGEALLLFRIGRTRQIPIYERLSYPLIALGFFSLLHDWGSVYQRGLFSGPAEYLTPFLNVYFMTSLLFLGALGYIWQLYCNKDYPSALAADSRWSSIIRVVIPAILLYTGYYASQLEIANYWDQRYAASAITLTPEGQDYQQNYYDQDLRGFQSIWIYCYSLLFFAVLSFFNLRKTRSRSLALVALGFSTLTIALFLTDGLYVLSELRDSYLTQTLAGYYHRGVFNIAIRYIAFAFVILLLVACRQQIRQDFIKRDLTIPFDALLYITLLWIASSELMNWLDVAGVQSDKLGLSILWGAYSLLLIILGLWKKKKHLRFGAIALFALTLAKLFLYDISHLETIAKTVVFVSLGLLLLLISFLYNKYQHIISENDEE